jgi:hypothetical protein
MKTPTNGVPVVRVDGLSHIEIEGNGYGRFCLYERRRIADSDKAILVPKRDILMPLCNLPDAIAKSMAAAALHSAGLYHWLPLSMH